MTKQQQPSQQPSSTTSGQGQNVPVTQSQSGQMSSAQHTDDAHKVAMQLHQLSVQHGLSLGAIFGLLSVFQKHAQSLGAFISDLQGALGSMASGGDPFAGQSPK